MMHDDDILAIRGISLFSTMSDQHFDDLFQGAYLQAFPQQLELIVEGDPADFLHILLEGTVELFSSANDRQATIFVLRSIAIYNVSAVLENAVYLMSARTLSKARILMIPARDLHNVMEVDLAFANAMAAELAKRYRMAIKSLKEHRLRSGIERLANYLLRANAQASNDGRIELTEDKRKLAALLGMTPEYLSRVLNNLKDYGVEVTGNKIHLKSLDALVDLAKPNPLIDRKII